MVTGLAFVWYEYESARDAVVLAEAEAPPIQANLDEAYRTAAAGNELANRSIAVAQAAADQNHGGNLEEGRRDIELQSINVTRLAQSEASSTSSADSPPGFAPLTCHP